MITITPAITQEHKHYLGSFALKKHVRLDNRWDFDSEDSFRREIDLPKGEFGEYIVGRPIIPGYMENSLECHPNTPSIICPFIIRNRISISDQEESPEIYKQWLDYLISTFMVRWFYILSGRLHFYIGEQGYHIIVDRNRTWIDKAQLRNNRRNQWMVHSDGVESTFSTVDAWGPTTVQWDVATGTGGAGFTDIWVDNTTDTTHTDTTTGTTW